MSDSTDPGLRMKAVLRVLKGEDPAAVAQDCGVDGQTLSGWRAHFLKAGMGAMEDQGPPTQPSSDPAIDEGPPDTLVDAPDTAPGSESESEDPRFSETSWFMKAVDIEEMEDLPEKVDVNKEEYAPREDVTTDVRRAYSLRDDPKPESD